MAAGLTIRRDRSTPSARASPSSPASGSRRPTSARSSGSTSRSASRDMTPELERLCRYLEPCGTGNPEPGLRRARRASRGPAARRRGHLKGVLDDGALAAPRDRLPVGRPGAMAGRRPGRRGVPAGAQRVERSGHAAGEALRAVSARLAQHEAAALRGPSAVAPALMPLMRIARASTAAGVSWSPRDAPGASHGRPGAGGLDEHPGRRLAGRPGARSLRGERRARPRGALPRRRPCQLRRAAPPRSRPCGSNIDALGVAPRDGPPGGRVRFPERLAAGRLRHRARRPALYH